MKHLLLSAPFVILIAAPFGIGLFSSAGSAPRDTIPRAPAPAPNPLKNAYFGDLHVHTKISVDSYLQKAMLTMADSYRFATGEPVIAPDGQLVKLSRPLDFVALTDHSENFATYDLCIEGHGPASVTASCRLAKEQRGTGTYLALGDLDSPENCGGSVESCSEAKRRTWEYVRWLAEQNNRPGQFTTFAAYEYSAAGGPTNYDWHVHRNVIFANAETPATAFTALDSNVNTDLWAWLERSCRDPCDVVAIPHNSNLSSGMQFGLETVEGKPYSDLDWRRRARFERLVEIYQIKGDSECKVGLGATDELCSMEQFAPKMPACPDGVAPSQREGCLATGSFARNGLKLGLELRKRLGFNPFEFGFVGSTDNHNALAGSTEANDYHGWRGVIDGSPSARLEPSNITSNPGGLAGVWATQNTREALFTGLKSRETFATSGTRIKVRFFGGWSWPAGAEREAGWIARGYRSGVPMGGTLKRRSNGTAPTFMIWAEADDLSAPLQRLQMVKGWMEADGRLMEKIFDIACASGRPDAASHRCREQVATLDLRTCRPDPRQGRAEMATSWRDPEFRADQSAFYYVRVIENPSCRWSTFEARRLGRPLSPLVPPTVQQRAWSSPIWYHP